MRDVILTGMMGTGKSTVGRIIAQRYGLRFVDTDEEIERRAGCSIAEFWSAHAEPAFRDLEHEVLGDVLRHGGGECIIATGAGALVAPRNRSLLDRKHNVICLTCELDELVTRISAVSPQVRQSRPLLTSADDVRATLARRLEKRRDVYALFEQLDTTGRPAELVAGDLAQRLRLSCAGRLSVTAQRESRVVFGRGLLGSIGQILDPSKEPVLEGVREGDSNVGGVAVVTDLSGENTCWPELAVSSLRDSGFRVHRISVTGGEESKTLATVELIYQECSRLGLERSSTILAIGGGVVTDIAGYVAATYLRGLRLVLAPTTLLAQVDAAIGGKTGVDLAGVKNIIGAFYPAELILLDPDVLGTLPPEAISDGLAEIVKIAVMRSAGLFDEVERLPDATTILHRPDIIRWAAQEKLRLVEADPYERADRALLNFGHTVGHAIETVSGFRLSHGQAISAGMVAEARLAEEKGWCRPGVLDRLQHCLALFQLPVVAPELDPPALVEVMRRDKKRRDGRMRFAIPREIGSGTLVEVEQDVVELASLLATGGSR